MEQCGDSLLAIKSGSEIDFVIDFWQKGHPVEVKYREFSQPIIPAPFTVL